MVYATTWSVFAGRIGAPQAQKSARRSERFEVYLFAFDAFYEGYFASSRLLATAKHTTAVRSTNSTSRKPIGLLSAVCGDGTDSFWFCGVGVADGSTVGDGSGSTLGEGSGSSSIFSQTALKSWAP